MADNESTTKTSPEGEAANDEMTALRRDRDELHDRLLRTTAEFDNYRKRTERERRELSEAAGVDVIRDLLPLLDDFERALATRPEAGGGRPTDAAEGYRKGVELIHRRALEILRKRGVEPFDAVGRDFDPTWHEAVASEPANGHRDGEITAEMSRGYRIGQRLLRPAQVKVARA
jgi:molecular chaperone GrpE